MRPLAFCAALPVLLVLSAPRARGGIVAPKNGGPLPASVLRLKLDRKAAFTVARGWTRRGTRAPVDPASRLASEAFAPGGVTPGNGVLRGRLLVPVVLGLYADAGSPPVAASELRRALFEGRLDGRTVGAYYREVSGGLFDVCGTVYDWAALEHPESYYVGLFQGTYPETDRTGEMIREILDRMDPSIDFGAFNSDGLDGVPNSGDDDGFVDVLLVIHPARGAECGYASHVWSHSWSYSVWPASGGEPYRTDDRAAGGGEILIDDYIIAPALSCDRDDERVNEIGVFCHEIGHTIGLPDLYDPNGGSVGIGDWGLMGTGNWNTPSSPAHPCGWSKEQLGWVETIEIDWRELSIELEPPSEERTVVKLPLPYTRFERRPTTALSGNWALVCGYAIEDAVNRRWPQQGYGNGWRESMVRRFRCEGGGAVVLSYDAVIDAEEGYDFGYVLLETGSATDTLAAYDGYRAWEEESFDLRGLIPPGACEFAIRFLFVSDDTESNEDGYYDSSVGFGFGIDDISVTGGGIAHWSDFEEDAGGWFADSPPAEYFLVENRRADGFDRHLHGEGILIWHAENSIAYSLFGNSGGFTDRQARGLVLEEADGFYNLLAGDNRGDAGDPFPGALGSTSFGSATLPNSRSNGGWTTPVAIRSISGGPRARARCRGGAPAPVIESVRPDTIDASAGAEAEIDIGGAFFGPGSICHLTRDGAIVRPDEIDWRGESRLIARFAGGSLLAGAWDLSIVGGDEQAATAVGAVTVRSIYEAAGVEGGRDLLAVEWSLLRTDGVRGCVLLRSADGGPFAPVSGELPPDQSGEFRFEDFSVAPGVSYAYRVVTLFDEGGEEALDLRGPYRIPDLPFIADQNYPNPFRDRTTIAFFAPRRMTLAIDIYDVAGRLVYSRGALIYERGTHEFDWAPTAETISAGVYFCVFRSGMMERVVKIVLVR